MTIEELYKLTLNKNIIVKDSRNSDYSYTNHWEIKDFEIEYLDAVDNNIIAYI